MKNVHPRFRKLAGVGPVAPVLLHQTRLSTAENRIAVIAEFVVERERDDEGKNHSRKVRGVTETRRVLVESGEKYLWAKAV